MPSTGVRTVQTAYQESGYDDTSAPLRDRIVRTTQHYMVGDLGLSETEALERAQKEIEGTIGRSVCDELQDLGIKIQGQTVLDLGAGLGGLSSELARRGAKVVGLEPGQGWYRIAATRLRGFESSVMLAGVGEEIPLASNSVDLIVSLQVLEHVQSPRQVIEEAYRVLKPGGHFYFSYENYFGFREPHYRVFWLPLLPKPLGALYLRLRGRNPQFLRESVTYTTFHGVRKLLRQTGFLCLRRDKSAGALRSPSMTSAKWRILKRLAAVNETATLNLIAAVDHAKRIFPTAVYECLRKPAD